MKKIRLLVSMLFLLMLGCSAVDNVPSGYRLNSDANSGVLLASVSYSGSYAEHSMLFREVGSTKWKKLKVGAQHTLLPPGMLEWDIEKPGLRGQVFAVELPAGEYEFASWYVGSGVSSTGPVNLFSIRFDIVAGHAVYAGNFHFVKEISRAVIFARFNVQLANEFERDAPLISQKFSALNLEYVDNNVARTESISRLGGGGATKVTIPMPVPVNY
ncbi:hypothetical protein [Halopseudomonas sabulinigri]